MLRFPNPGSSIDSFLRIYVALFEELNSQSDFDLDDFSEALIKRNLATSCGYAGNEALQRSRRSDRSRDPIYNQAKMYSECFKVLGWLHPTKSSALRFQFTFLGAHVVAAQRDPDEITRQSLLGICYPNSILDVKGTHDLRPIVTILRAAAELDGLLHRDEMITGPMSLASDRDGASFQSMISDIRGMRGDYEKLKKAIDKLSKTRKIAFATMTNYTRFPIGALKWSGWMQTKRTRGVYGRSLVFLELTDSGYNVLKEVEEHIDVRKDDLESISDQVKDAIVKLGFYQLLERSGFDVVPVQTDIDTAKSIVATHYSVPAPELLFSPYQLLSSEELQITFPYTSGDDISDSPSSAIGATPSSTKPYTQTVVSLQHVAEPAPTLGNPVEALIQDRIAKGFASLEIADDLMKYFAATNQDKFYPLIGDLFQLLGFDCIVSRHGVNYARWDAIIDHTNFSIPIEIKSPGEEEYLSVKAVRQALENKIVLLSRKSHATSKETTSLAVGYHLPNDRSEVSALIDDIFETFGILIGVIDLHTLLLIAAEKVKYARGVSFEEIRLLRGYLSVEAA